MEYWSNINTATKNPKLTAAAYPFLLTFPTSCMAEADISHFNAILTKQGNKLNLQNRGDLRFTTEYQQSYCVSSSTSTPSVPTILLQRCVNVALMLAISWLTILVERYVTCFIACNIRH